MLRACLCALAAAVCFPSLAQAQEAIPTAAAPASDAPLPPAPPPPLSAAVGTHGYREAGGVVCQPVGDHTAVTIGVDVGGYGGRGR